MTTLSEAPIGIGRSLSNASGKATDCNNDLVLQSINNLQKDITEIKSDIKAINTSVSEIKGDIKVIDKDLNTLNINTTTNSNDIKGVITKIHFIFGGLAVLAFVIPYVTNLISSIPS